MTEIYVNMNRCNRKRRIFEIITCSAMILWGISYFAKDYPLNSFNIILGVLLFSFGGARLFIALSAHSSFAAKYVNLNGEVISYRQGSFSREKQIHWAEITTVQLNKRMVKIDYHQSQSVELFDFTHATDEDLTKFNETISAIASARGIKVEK